MTCVCRRPCLLEGMEDEISMPLLLEQAVNKFARVDEPALLTFPEGEADAVTVTDSDMRSLQPTATLSCNTVCFYIKYLEKQMLPPIGKDRSSVVTFLGKPVGTSGSSIATKFEQVRKCIWDADLFGKDYVVIPIHEGVHWSLIIIRGCSRLRGPPADEHKVSSRIIHLDSDIGRHKDPRFKQYIHRCISQAWTRRHQSTDVNFLPSLSEVEYVPAKVPQADNEYDSGVYMLHYIELFIFELALPDSSFGSSEGEPHFTRWDSSGVVDKRKHIRDLILKFSGMTKLQLTLRLNYHLILSWLKGEGISEGRIQDLQIEDPTIVHAEGAEFIELGEGETEPVNERSGDASFEHEAVDLMYGFTDPDFEVGLSHQQLQKERNTSSPWTGGENDVLLKSIAEGSLSDKGKGTDWDLISEGHETNRGLRRKRRRNWSDDETQVLLQCMAENRKFDKAKGTRWDLISSVISERVGSSRSEAQVRHRYDTLLKSFRSAERYCQKVHKQFSELTEAELRLNEVRMISTKWYNLLDIICRRNTERFKLTPGGDNGLPSVSPSKLAPRSSDCVRTVSVSDPSVCASTGYLSLLTDSISAEIPFGSYLEHSLSPDHSPHTMLHQATPASTSSPQSQLGHVQERIGPFTGIYCRSRKNMRGDSEPIRKYEPRVKPPREKLDSGRTEVFQCLPLGQYDTQEDAYVVRRIALFYYRRGAGALELADGSTFIIPGLAEGEELLRGVEKARCVTRKAKEVFKIYKEWRMQQQSSTKTTN